MSTLKRLALGTALVVVAAPAFAQAPQFGQPIAPADLAPWDISIGPDGAGLPPGRGTPAQGASVYAAKCQACHGEKGGGGPNDRLVGRKAEPLTAAPVEPPPRSALRLEEPATHPEAAAQALERLIPNLARKLQERHLGARRRHQNLLRHFTRQV